MAKILCFGEILLRVAPVAAPFVRASDFGIAVGGAEANVAAALAQLGHDAALLSILPASPLGERALVALRGLGVDMAPVLRAPGRMGLYFVEPGAGPRPTQIVYDRERSAFATGVAALRDRPGSLHADWLHISGITPALGAECAAITLEVVRAARRAGGRISFDCNYRPSLWAGAEESAGRLFAALAAEADLLFGNHRDIALMTGLRFDGPAAERDAADAAFAAFPRLSHIAATARTITGIDGQTLAASLHLHNATIERDAIRMTGIVDRIGAGDAFAAGVLHGLAEGADAGRALDHGLAAAVQKHYIPGDIWMGKRSDLDAVGSDIQR